MNVAENFSKVQLVAFDFDGVFTDNAVYVSQDGNETVRCWRGDGLGLARLRSVGVPIFIVSTEVNPVVGIRARKLKIPFIQGVEDKASAIGGICKEAGVTLERAMFVGNDINDIPAFRFVGFPVAVADAHPDVDPYVSYRTQRAGGLGAVREVCDLIFFAKRGQ